MGSVQNIFVAGPGRSGTTLLSLVLNSHSQIAVCPETNHLPWLFLHGKAPGFEEQFRDVIRGDEKLAGLKVGTAGYIDEALRAHYSDYTQAIDAFLSWYRLASKPSACIVGQKKNYLDIWPSVLEVYPQAKFVAIFRDCRSTAPSAERNLPGQTLYTAAKSWQHRAAMADLLKAKHPRQYFEIRFEDFVAQPQKVCESLCEFLEVPFEQSMLAHHKTNAQLDGVTKGQEAKHVKTARSIDAKEADAWRERVSSWQIRCVESIARTELKNRGYVTDTNTGLLDALARFTMNIKQIKHTVIRKV